MTNPKTPGFRDHLGLARGIDPSQITLSTSFIQDTGADSLDLVELVMEIEEEFGVMIPDDEAEQMKTLADVIAYIMRKRTE